MLAADITDFIFAVCYYRMQQPLISCLFLLAVLPALSYF